MAQLSAELTLRDWNVDHRAIALAASGTTETTAPCPKCRTIMVLAAITPHPVVKQMERHTFVCSKCNQTKSYMLQANRAGPVA